MRKMILSAAILLVSGCGMPVTPSTSESNEVASKIVYVKDRMGICYAVISSYGYGSYTSFSITSVPCESVKL